METQIPARRTKPRKPLFRYPICFCCFQTMKRVAGICVVILAFWNMPMLYHMWQTSTQEPSVALAENGNLTILIWTKPFGQALNLTGDVCSGLVQAEGCYLTHDHDLLGQADVVVFHHAELSFKNPNLPKDKAHPEQKWVWVSMESPSHTNALADWSGIFNWVLTYRSDSDIFVPYGELVPQLVGHVDIPNKTGLAIWVISNYNRRQKRVWMYRKLSRYIKIDVYGKAVQKTLCPEHLLHTISKYKFYLAFENSIYKDYITEKLWRNSLLAGTVPVVLGPPRVNYEKYLPKDAFIHVEDFSSMKDLANYLVNMSMDEYQSFFQWRQNYGVKLYDSWSERFCPICEYYPRLPREKVYPSVKKWFLG